MIAYLRTILPVMMIFGALGAALSWLDIIEIRTFPGRYEAMVFLTHCPGEFGVESGINNQALPAFNIVETMLIQLDIPAERRS